MRIAILAGVSTDAQTKDDKLSIPDQIKTCRAYIAANGAKETAGPFVMDGYSRSGYDSLEIAMREIPPLAQAIAAAESNKYDILIMDNFDRLGDLGFIVGVRFKKLRKQLHSARQSGKLTPPELYDPYANESNDIAMYIEGIIQTYRINKIRRGWSIGVPNRARSGLHPLSIPFGYKVSTQNEPAAIIPEETDLIIQMMDLFLRGMPFQQIAEFADASGIKPRRAPRWQLNVVRRIIANSYYAGETSYGKYKARIPQPRSQWVVGTGKHQPIITTEKHNAILAEFERRKSLRTRSSTYTLSGLLYCAKCGQRLDRHGKTNGQFDIYLSCRSIVPHCTSIKYKIALPLVADKIVDALQSHRTVSDITAGTLELTQKINAAQERRRKIQDGFENNLYTPAEAGKRITAIETEIEKYTAQITRLTQQHQHQTTLLQIANTDLTQLRNWILNDDPTTVNRLLTALCEKIIITPKTHELTIIFR